MLLSPAGIPICSAVAVRDVSGRPVLATAAHCVTAGEPRSSWRFATWLQRTFTVSDSHTAQLLSVDSRGDIATLSAEWLPAPLPRGWPPREGEPLHVVAAVYDWRISEGLALNSREASFSVLPGFSGSPVIDARGAVVGLVAGCNGTKLEAGATTVTTCRPGWAAFTGLP